MNLGKNKSYMKNAYRIILLLALLCLGASILLFNQAHYTAAGLLATAFFIGLALGIRKLDILKGFSFTILIFAAVCLSLFFPSFLPFSDLSPISLRSLSAFHGGVVVKRINGSIKAIKWIHLPTFFFFLFKIYRSLYN